MTNAASKQVTKATAKKLVRAHAQDLNTEIDGEAITIWFANPADPEREERAAEAIARSVPGGATVRNTGSKLEVFYRRAPLDLGDWNDTAARWHY